MNNNCDFLFICMIFVCCKCFSQSESKYLHKPLQVLQEYKPLHITQFIPGKSIATNSKEVPFLSANYYATQLGFFCKQEIKFDKITKMPFRFRLGSLEQCNWLEGKSRAF